MRSVWCPLPSSCHQVLDPRWPCPQGSSLSYRRRLAVTLGSEASAGVLWARPGVLAVSSCRAEPPHRTRPCPRQRHPGTLGSLHFCSRQSEVFFFPRKRLLSGFSGQTRCASVCPCVHGGLGCQASWSSLARLQLCPSGMRGGVPGCPSPSVVPWGHRSLTAAFCGPGGSLLKRRSLGGQGTLSPETPPAAQVTGHSAELPPAPLDGVPGPSRPTQHPAPRKTLWGPDPCAGSVRLGAPRSAALCDSSELS